MKQQHRDSKLPCQLTVVMILTWYSKAFSKITPALLNIYEKSGAFDSEIIDFLWKITNTGVDHKLSPETLRRMSTAFFLVFLKNVQSSIDQQQTDEDLKQKKIRFLSVILTVLNNNQPEVGGEFTNTNDDNEATADNLKPFLDIKVSSTSYVPTLEFLLSNITQVQTTDNKGQVSEALIELDLLHTLLLLLRSVPSDILETSLRESKIILPKLRYILWRLLTTKLPFKSLYLLLAISNHTISIIGWEWTALSKSEASEFVTLTPFPSSVSPESPKTKLFETIIQRTSIEIDLGLRDIVNRTEVEKSNIAKTTTTTATTNTTSTTTTTTTTAAATTGSTMTESKVDVASPEEKLGVLLLSYSLLQSSLDFAISQLDDDDHEHTANPSEAFPSSVLLKTYEFVKKYSEETLQFIAILQKRTKKAHVTNLSQAVDSEIEIPVLFSGISLVTRYIAESIDPACIKKMMEFLPFLFELSEVFPEILGIVLESVLGLLKTDEVSAKDLLAIRVKRKAIGQEKLEESFITWLVDNIKVAKTASVTPVASSAISITNEAIQIRALSTIATIIAIAAHNTNKSFLQDSNLILTLSGLYVDLVEAARAKISLPSSKQAEQKWNVSTEIETVGYLCYTLLETIRSTDFPTSKFLCDSDTIIYHITEGLEMMFRFCVTDFDNIQEDSLVLWVLETCAEICLELPKFRDAWKGWTQKIFPSPSHHALQHFVQSLR